MARVRLTPPEPVLFSTPLKVQVGDLNYGNHLANDAVLRLVHEVRLRWLTSGGFSEMDAGGAGLIMADAMVQYVSQAFYGDELMCQISIGEIGRSGFEIYTKILHQNGAVIAIIKNGMVCFDYSAQKVVNIPEALLNFIHKKSASS